MLGVQVRYDLADGFPLLTTRLIPWRLAFAEMLWFVSGHCNDLAGLVQLDFEGRTIDARKLWRPWASAQLHREIVGPIYGVQWRSWAGRSAFDDHDQLQDVIAQLSDPKTRNSRRLIVSSWQPSEIDEMALPPCHVLYQFFARGSKLSMLLYQRSCDLPIGGPFNVAGYALLLSLVARITGLEVGEFIHSIGDAHVYENQVDAVERWLARSVDAHETLARRAPRLEIADRGQLEIEDFRLADLRVIGYDHMGSIEIPVSV